jgi:hypothetical protein
MQAPAHTNKLVSRERERAVEDGRDGGRDGERGKEIWNSH